MKKSDEPPPVSPECAWCLAELAAQGIEIPQPAEGESHGICPEHAEQIYAAWQAGRAAKTAA